MAIEKPSAPSRRALLHAATGAAALLVARPRPAPAQMKVSQAAVGYQNQPSGNQTCANCAHFRQPNQCQLVNGEISPQGWCRLYGAASGQTAATPGTRNAY